MNLTAINNFKNDSHGFLQFSENPYKSSQSQFIVY